MPSPWLQDASSLVDAYRRGETSPEEQTTESLAAIAASELNAFCHIDADAALASARAADVSLPFGGVPMGIKELEQVEGWPFTRATLLLKDQIAEHTTTQVHRLRAAGAVTVGLTNSPEIGLVAYTSTPLHGTTRNPWDPRLTPGGSSGGTAAAVAGGLVPIGSGSDGGGSIRIPAAYSGLVGLKTSFRRIPFGPPAQMEPLTTTVGCLSRSVRDTARWLDVCEGPDPRDPFALPAAGGWEAGLGTRSLSGLRVAVLPDLGGTAVVHPDVVAVVEQAAALLVKAAGLIQVDAVPQLPVLDFRWVIPGLPNLFNGLAQTGLPLEETLALLTPEVRQAVQVAAGFDVNLAGMVDPFRTSVIEGFADVFESVDLIICATCPDDAHVAEGPSPTRVGDVTVEPYNAGRLTMGANLAHLPAISVPAGLTPSGMPVGLQIIAQRFEDARLLDLALLLEREQPWPLVAPGVG